MPRWKSKKELEPTIVEVETPMKVQSEVDQLQSEIDQVVKQTLHELLSDEQKKALQDAIQYMKLIYRSTNTIDLRLDLQKTCNVLTSILEDD